MNSPIDFSSSLSFSPPLDSLWFPGIELTPAKNNKFFSYMFMTLFSHSNVRMGILLFAQLFSLVSHEDSASQIPLRVPDTEPEFWPSALGSHCFGEWVSGVLGVRGFSGLGTHKVDGPLNLLHICNAYPRSHPSFFLEPPLPWLVFSGAQQVIVGERNDQKKKKKISHNKLTLFQWTGYVIKQPYFGCISFFLFFI